MVMVVFEAAVTLSLMFIVTGLPSPMGISRPVSGTSIVGLVGSVNTQTSHFSHVVTLNLRYGFIDAQPTFRLSPHFFLISLQYLRGNTH